ncbi:MAG: pseudaminic acid cytidylyltransferase [Bacteroidetes bacterium]|nr:pseudaminic acid cytidylyltransferase [Bacteroidota bacterium]
MQNNIAIITARGGSKRIPKKNIKDFLGNPIISYSISVAIESKLFNEVIVSTDNEEIATVAKQFGATVPFIRSAKNADDFATTADVLLEVINDLENSGRHYSNACCIYPTSPLLQSDSLQTGFNLLIKENYNSVFPIVKFGYPIQRCLQVDDANKVSMKWEENLNKRSQDLQPLYHDAGMFYWINIEALKKEQKLFTSNSGAIILDETEVQDIDNLTDWKMAELKYKMMNENL